MCLSQRQRYPSAGCSRCLGFLDSEPQSFKFVAADVKQNGLRKNDARSFGHVEIVSEVHSLSLRTHAVWSGHPEIKCVKHHGLKGEWPIRCRRRVEAARADNTCSLLTTIVALPTQSPLSLVTGQLHGRAGSVTGEIGRGSAFVYTASVPDGIIVTPCQCRGGSDVCLLIPIADGRSWRTIVSAHDD